MKLRNLLLVCLMLVAILAGCHRHTWTPATCTEPEHCSQCEKTRGTPLGHTWMPADCTVPETCSVCGETRGEPLGHASGAWASEKEATYAESGIRVRRCTRCKEVLEEEAVFIPVFENGFYVCTANELAARIQTYTDRLVPGLTVETSYDDQATCITVQEGDDLVCAISFPKDAKVTSPDLPLNTPLIVSMLIGADPQLHKSVETAIVMAFDPTLTEEDAQTLLTQCKKDQTPILHNDTVCCIQSLGFSDILYTGTEEALTKFLDGLNEKSKIPYFEMEFSDFVAEHNETYATEKLELRKTDTGYSYYLNNKMLGIVFAKDLNKDEQNKATAYGTAGQDEAFNMLRFRMIDQYASKIDPNRFTLALMTGSVMVTPLMKEYNMDLFLEHQKVLANTDERIEMVYVDGNVKYTMTARRDHAPIAQVVYDFTCELT